MNLLLLQEQAEGISSIWSECFHLVYTEAMVELIEETIDVAISVDPSRTSGTSTYYTVVCIVATLISTCSPVWVGISVLFIRCIVTSNKSLFFLDVL